MVITRLLPLILLLQPDLPGRGMRHPLPPSARIGDLKVVIDRKDPSTYMCDRYHPTARQIRNRFRTYRQLGPTDEHDHYAWYPCSVEATIVYRGKSFSVKANMANTMWTDWPDGRQKEMGGAHDGELSD